MHVPEHMLSGGVEAVAGVAAAAAVVYAVSRARRDRSPNEGASPVHRGLFAGAVAGFLFAAQMLNVPLGQGLSGHLIGGVLAVALLGPWIGTLAMTAVLAAQAVVFADGGVTTLGVNVLLMAVVPAVAWLLVGRWQPTWSPRVRAAVAAPLSVLVSAGLFAGLFAASGGADVGAVAVSMLQVHVGVAVFEGMVTVGLLAAATRLAPALTYSAEPGRRQTVSPPAAVGWVAGAALLAGVGLSRFASGHPDGLEFVAGQHEFLPAVEQTPLLGWLAGYGELAGVDVAVAGLVGIVLVGAVVAASAYATATGWRNTDVVG